MTLVSTDGTERSRSVVAGWVADAAGLGSDLLATLVKSRDRVVALSPDQTQLSLVPARRRGKAAVPTATVSLKDPRAPGIVKAWVGRRDAVLRLEASQALTRHFEVPARAAVHLPGIVTSRLGQLSPCRLTRSSARRALSKSTRAPVRPRRKCSSCPRPASPTRWIS
jgi:hypothetical protein